jgi:DNA-binding MarR family transcriptional regulator
MTRDAVDELVEQWRRERPDLPEDGLLAMATIGRLGRLQHLAGREIERTFASHDLQIGEFDVLAALRRSGPPFELAPTDLVRQLMLSSGAMTNRLDRLEARGLLRRRPHPTDRRGVIVVLTPEGRELVDAAVADHVVTESRLLAALTAPQRRQLDELLRGLLAGLESLG